MPPSGIVDNEPKGHFRRFIPDLDQGKFIALPGHNAHTWKDEFFKNEYINGLVDEWMALRREPYKGLTSDGSIVSDLYQHQDHGVDFGPIVAATLDLFSLCSEDQLKSLQEPMNSRTWRSWSNPEIYLFKCGLRLEEVDQNVTDAILVVIQRTLSPEGYNKVRNAMKTNAFLGELCNGKDVMNEGSYNFVIYGQPSEGHAWGWSIYGHHLCMNTFLDRGQVHIAPVFIGSEPNEIDEGPNRGVVMMREEEAAGLCLMQSLSVEKQQAAQIYDKMHDDRMPPGRYNRADQRHLCGAFQDNRVVPYEGILVSEMNEHEIRLVFDIFENFLIYLPEPSRRQRLLQIKDHLADTYFSWIGPFTDKDAFYFRIQSPVVVVEFDHHSGVFLVNKEPQRFHIHTIARAPNGGDYGNALRVPEDRLD